MVAVAHRARLNSRGVRTGLRFGEAESAENFALRQAREIFFLLRVRASFQRGTADDGIGDAQGDGDGGVHAGDFFEHQGIADRVRACAAPFLGDEHAAAAEFAEFFDLFGGKFFLALVFAEDGPHFRFHELADGVADKDLIAAE